MRHASRRTPAWLMVGAALVVATCPAAPAKAFRFSDGSYATCRDSEGRAVAEVISPVPQGFAGLTRPLPGGGWMISWDPALLAALGPVEHDFIFYHECAHASVPTLSELAANCQGLIDMRREGRSSPEIEERLARFHESLGDMGPRYGGHGADYWRRTIECVDGGDDPADSETQFSTLCQFTFGPLAGRIVDYFPQPPLPVGTPCNDGFMSVGIVVAGNR